MMISDFDGYKVIHSSEIESEKIKEYDFKNLKKFKNRNQKI